MKQLFATTARGFEELLKVELTELGATECKIAQGGVHFQADDETLYRSLLWSRLASRILLPIVNGKVYSDLDLYSIVTGQDWLSYFDEKATFFVRKPHFLLISTGQTKKFAIPNLVRCV